MQIKYLLSALPLISCSLVAALGVFVLAQNRHGRINYLFAALCLSLCVYNFGAFSMYILKDAAAAAAASTACILSTAFLIGLLPHFIFAFVSHNGGLQKFTAFKLSFFYAAAALIIVLTLNDFIVNGVTLTPTGFISLNGPYFILYAAAMAFSGFYSILYLYYSQSGGDADDYKVKSRHILLGILISFLFGIFDILKKIAGIFTEISTLEYGIIVFCALSAYAIVKHKFLHIEFAVKKGVLYSILMILVALTVLSVAVAAEQITQNWLDSSSFSINLLNALLVGFFFDPVKDWLQRILNKYFFPRLTNIKLDDTLIKNKAVLECIAGEKIDELKLLKTNIERIITEYENNH